MSPIWRSDCYHTILSLKYYCSKCLHIIMGKLFSAGSVCVVGSEVIMNLKKKAMQIRDNNLWRYAGKYMNLFEAWSFTLLYKFVLNFETIINFLGICKWNTEYWSSFYNEETCCTSHLCSAVVTVYTVHYIHRSCSINRYVFSLIILLLFPKVYFHFCS